MTKFDTYQEVTAAIITQLEAGTRPWRCEWQRNGASAFGPMPRRANGDYYRGINVLLLWQAAGDRGFTADRWMTFKQALELGGAVRKGEKSTRIVFFKALDRTAIDQQTGEEVATKVPMLRTYSVFNVEQIDGLPAEYYPAPFVAANQLERDHQAEAALRSCGATIRESGDKAFYAPGPDLVNMPEFCRFESVGGFLATMAHELCHWTGHKARLDRNMRGRFGSNDYAFEELVAEIGAAFIGARLGIVGEHIDNHAAYLSHWLEVLQGDKRAIFKAASLAQAAADRVLENAGDPKGGETVEELEAEPVEAAEITRDQQLVQLRAASPMRPVAGRTDDIDGLGLFDAVRQPELAL